MVQTINARTPLLPIDHHTGSWRATPSAVHGDDRLSLKHMSSADKARSKKLMPGPTSKIGSGLQACADKPFVNPRSPMLMARQRPWVTYGAMCVTSN
mmetsp:Transcript_98558/g.205519  ORF Transcript_98558/g.205519 Transcript_98558/m.205519 type:complete len:97 (+) Transcript_98558:268-558(+)